MDDRDATIKKLGSLLEAEVEIEDEKCIIKKKRPVRISIDKWRVGDKIELDVYLECCSKGKAGFNRAEVFLLSDECEKFMEGLIQYEVPLPNGYRHWQVGGSTIVCIRMESNELPEHFAARISAALERMEDYNF